MKGQKSSGYLKAVRHTFNTELGKAEYELQLTNREVRAMFEGLIEGRFKRCRRMNNAFLKALLSYDLESMNEYMNDISYEMFSYFDVAAYSSERSEPGRFYHGFVLGLMVELKSQYVITSNRESGFGRYDVMLEPRQSAAALNAPMPDAIIIEFKSVRTRRGETLEGAVQAALAQIEAKGCESVLRSKGIPKDRIKKYAFAFEEKRVLIGSALYESREILCRSRVIA